MQSPNNTSHHDFVYRRIPDYNLNLKDYSIRPSAFSCKEGESISVFSPLICTPRDILQLCINEQKGESCSPHLETKLKGRNFLNKNGTTVEQLVDKGWRVAKIKTTLFIEKGSQVGRVEFTGHQDIWVKTDNINILRKFWSDKAELLTAEQCLSKRVPKEIFFRRNFNLFFVTFFSLTKRIKGKITSFIRGLLSSNSK